MCDNSKAHTYPFCASQKDFGFENTEVQNYLAAVDKPHMIAVEIIQKLDKLLAEIKEVENTSSLPNGDVIDVTTALWLVELIQTFEATKEIMKGGETNHEQD